MNKRLRVIALLVMTAACGSSGPDYRGAWTSVEEPVEWWLFGKDSIVLMGSDGRAQGLAWRVLDDGSLFLQTDEGGMLLEVVLHTSDRLSLHSRGDTLHLVRDLAPPEHAEDFLAGRLAPSRLVQRLDSVRTMRERARERALREAREAAMQPVPVDWILVDHDERTVEMEITAGLDQTNNRWNFNGYAHGAATIVVPEGYEVRVRFFNNDPVNPHSLAVDPSTSTAWPAIFRDPRPAFAGAITSSPTSMTQSTLPGEAETITFTADRSGSYSMVCYVPAHAATGMWIHFEVSAEGKVGLVRG